MCSMLFSFSLVRIWHSLAAKIEANIEDAVSRSLFLKEGTVLKEVNWIFFFLDLQTVPACQNLYKNSFIYHSLKEDKVLPFDECLEFIGESLIWLPNWGCEDLFACGHLIRKWALELVALITSCLRDDLKSHSIMGYWGLLPRTFSCNRWDFVQDFAISCDQIIRS